MGFLSEAILQHISVPVSGLMDLAYTHPAGDIHYTARGNINNNLLKICAAPSTLIASPYSSNLLYLKMRW